MSRMRFWQSFLLVLIGSAARLNLPDFPFRALDLSSSSPESRYQAVHGSVVYVDVRRKEVELRLNLAVTLVLFGMGLTLPELAMSRVLAASPMQIEVSPSRVRQGQTVTLSGSLFQRHVPLQIQMSCPPLFGGRGATTRPGQGPVTDSRGNFKGFRFRTVKQATNRVLQCFFMAAECPPCGTPAKTPFTLLPPARKREFFTRAVPQCQSPPCRRRFLRPMTKRHSIVVDAGTGRRIISYRFP